MTASLLATAAVGSLAQTFDGLPPDVDPDGPFAEAVEWAVDEDLTRPFPDGEFKGTRDITRAALATWYYRLAGEPEGPFEEPAATDVDEDTNFYTEISWALENGVMNVFPDGNFNPNRPTVRQAAAAITFQNAGSPEGDFSQAAIDAFPDVDENTTFVNEIGWLVENGWTDAFDDGEWKPNRDVSRFAMAAWFFRIYAEVEVPVDTLRVVAADTGDDLVYLSDGAAVTEYEYTDDSFEINGTPSSIGAFENFLGNAPDVLIETRVEGDDVIHNVTRGELVLSGLIGNNQGEEGAPPTQTDFAIVDFPSGVALTNITLEIVGPDRNFFTVDGDDASITTFLANIGIGDFIEVEVLEAGEEPDFSDFIFRHNLTNGELSGTIAAGEEGPAFIIDAVAGDDADVTTFPTTPHYTIDVSQEESESVVYLIDGEDDDGEPVSQGDFVDAATEGAAFSYSRAGGVETFDVASVDPAVFEAFSGVVLTGDVDAGVPNVFDSFGALTLIVDGELFADFTLDPTAAGLTVVGEGIVTRAEFNETIKLGDTLSCTAGELDEDGDPVCTTVQLTPDTLTAQVVAGSPDALVPGDPLFSIDLGLEDPFVVGLDVVLEPFGFGGLDVGFTANGQGVYEVDEDTDVLVDADFILFSIDETPLNDTPVTITLTDEEGSFEVGGDDVDYDFLWEFDGFPSDVIAAAIAAALAD